MGRTQPLIDSIFLNRSNSIKNRNPDEWAKPLHLNYVDYVTNTFISRSCRSHTASSRSQHQVRTQMKATLEKNSRFMGWTLKALRTLITKRTANDIALKTAFQFTTVMNSTERSSIKAEEQQK